MRSRIRSSLNPSELAQLAVRQVNALFPDSMLVAVDDLAPAIAKALSRLEHCFSQVNNGYFFDGNQAVFDHLHGDQYSMWLYFLSNELYRTGGAATVCKKLFLLNKALHGCDLFYEVELPSIFLLVHPLATVLGRGNYGDHLVVYQRCGIGSNHGVYPTLEAHVTLHPGSAVLGRCTVGSGCSIAAESLLLDQDIPAGSLYIGNPRDHILRTNPSENPIWRK